MDYKFGLEDCYLDYSINKNELSCSTQFYAFNYNIDEFLNLKFNAEINILLNSGKLCPKCEIQIVRTELKLLSNKFLTCVNCKTFYSLVGNQLMQVAI